MNAQGIPRRPGAPHRCPGCRAVLATSARACPKCGLGLVGPTAQRLWWIDAELASLELRRNTLLEERPALLARLRWETRAAEPVSTPSAPAAPVSAPMPPAPLPVSPTREVSGRSAQNVILGLGALLVGIAALVFAVWTWSDLGTGARATVLGLTTLTFTVVAVPLYRRGLRSTSEAFALVAALLMCVDALALWFLSDGLTNGPGYTAAALAVIAALLALYPALVPLRSPRVLTALLAQPVPVLLVAAQPDSHPAWWFTALGATALADAVAAHVLGTPRQGVPVRTLRGAAVTLWGVSTLLSVVVGTFLTHSDNEPSNWWSLATTLFLGGVTGLLLARAPGRNADAPSVYSVTGLSALALLPLAAGPSTLPALPRPTVPPWSLSPSDMSTPALVPPDHATLYVAGVVVAAFLALGSVWALRRRSLFVIAVLLAPSTLLAVPMLLGTSQTITVVWTLLVGAALLSCVGRLRESLSTWLLGMSGLATMLLGLTWSSVERHTMLSALILLAAIALVSALSARRPSPEGNAAEAVYGLTVIVWAVALVIGGASLAATAVGALPGQGHGPWWLLGVTGLLLGATALLLDGVASRVLGASEKGSAEFGPFGIGGLLLLIAQPLVVGPAGLPVLEPAHEFAGLSGDTTSSGLAVALGTLVVGALAVGAVRLFHQRLFVPAAALLAPVTLVPLPFALGSPFLIALVCTVLVAAALTAGSALVHRAGTAWVVWSSGLFTFALAFSWALSERYAAVGVLLAWAVTASMTSSLARARSITVASTAAATFGTGAFALALLLALGVSAEYAAFGPLLVVAAVAAAAPRLRSPLLEATEIPAAMWAAIALVITVSAGTRLELVALALAVVGVIGLASAVRPGRSWPALVGGLLMFCSTWTALAAWDVTTPEAYTVPPALAFLLIGREWERRAGEKPSSWLSYGGGLLLLLGPTVWLALDGQDLGWRVPATLVVGVATAVWGLRSRLQAQLLLGGGALLTVSLRAFGPPLWDLTLLLPNWVPFAVVGLSLLLIGARYEANLNRLRRVGRYVGALR